jgi:hypothetical protein
MALVLTRLVSIGLRPAAAVLAEGRRAERWALRSATDAATLTTLAALDALLRSRLLDEAVELVLDSRLVGELVDGLLEREQLWVLVDRVAQSPAVAAALRQQSIGMGDELAGEVRERSRDADAWLERGARRVLRRRPPPKVEPA